MGAGVDGRVSGAGAAAEGCTLPTPPGTDSLGFWRSHPSSFPHAAFPPYINLQKWPHSSTQLQAGRGQPYLVHNKWVEPLSSGILTKEQMKRLVTDETMERQR